MPGQANLYAQRSANKRASQAVIARDTGQAIFECFEFLRPGTSCSQWSKLQSAMRQIAARDGLGATDHTLGQC
eukprot:6214475-Pleurochrysis_carterae.AAC.1